MLSLKSVSLTVSSYVSSIKNKVLLIPILLDSEKDNINLFDDNIFYEKWNVEKNNFQLLEYLLPSEDLEDLNKIQEMSNNIENYIITTGKGQFTKSSKGKII